MSQKAGGTRRAGACRGDWVRSIITSTANGYRQRTRPGCYVRPATIARADAVLVAARRGDTVHRQRSRRLTTVNSAGGRAVGHVLPGASVVVLPLVCNRRSARYR